MSVAENQGPAIDLTKPYNRALIEELAAARDDIHTATRTVAALRPVWDSAEGAVRDATAREGRVIRSLWELNQLYRFAPAVQAEMINASVAAIDNGGAS